MFKRNHINSILFILVFIGYSNSMIGQGYRVIIDSLRFREDTTQISPEKVRLLNEIAYNQRRLTPDSMLFYARKAYLLARIIRDKQGEAIASKNIGIAHYKKASPIDTIVAYNANAVSIAREIKDYYTEAACNNNIALAYMQRNELEKSLKYFLEALDILDANIKTPQYLKALILGNSGTIYAMKGDHQQAYSYLKDAISFSKENDFKRTGIIYLDNLASAEYELGREEAAINTIEEGLVLQRELGDAQSLTQTLVTYSNILLRENRLEEAKEKGLEGYNIAKEKEFQIEICKALDNLSKIELQQGNNQQAMVYATEALGIASEMDNLRFQVDALRTLVTIYTENKDYKNALFLRDRIKGIEDSTRIVLNEVIDLKSTYDLRKQQRTIDSLAINAIYLEKEKELTTSQMNQEQTRLFLIIVLLATALISVALFWYIYHNRRLKEANEDLIIARKAAEEASRIKQEFLSTMSHEIRTPMNAVIGFTDLLLEDAPKSSQVPMLQNLKTSGKHLMNLINDILDLAKLEADKIELEHIPFDLKASLQQLIDIFNITKENKALSLSLEWAGEPLRQYVLGDSVRLTQIISNLLSNALKFTEQGHVLLRITPGQVQANRQRFTIAVEDTGIGIASEKKQSIFDNFSQASTSTTREFGGTGLGLAITKQLLELYESKIVLESLLGKGSTFSFDLELELGSVIVSKSQNSTFDYAAHQLDNIHVLLVEDNVFNQKIAEKILNRLGVRVTIAEDGELAIQKVKEEGFDLVFMDLQLPNLNGYEAIPKIRHLKPTLPIVALTAEVTKETIDRLRAMEIDHIGKPFQVENLYEALVKHLT